MATDYTIPKGEYRALLDENARLRSCLSDDAENARMIMDENAKLRELVRDVYHELDAATQYEAGGGRGVVSEFAYRMRELGIEVER